MLFGLSSHQNPKPKKAPRPHGSITTQNRLRTVSEDPQQHPDLGDAPPQRSLTKCLQGETPCCTLTTILCQHGRHGGGAAKESQVPRVSQGNPSSPSPQESFIRAQVNTS